MSSLTRRIQLKPGRRRGKTFKTGLPATNGKRGPRSGWSKNNNPAYRKSIWPAAKIARRLQSEGQT